METFIKYSFQRQKDKTVYSAEKLLERECLAIEPISELVTPV